MSNSNRFLFLKEAKYFFSQHTLMNDLMLKKIEDNTIKDVRSLFRPKKKIRNNSAVRDIRIF